MTPWMLLLFFQQPQILELPAVERNPHSTAQDLEIGKRLYAGRCAGCHGPSGNGGKGANLALPVLSRAGTDLGLYRVIRYGIPETEMPGSNMAPREIWQIAAFVKTLGALSTDRIAGDAGRGRELLRSKGRCLQCHSIGTEGGSMGPALTGVGRRRSPGFLRAKLLDSAGNLPDDFRMVQVATRDGRKLSGIRLNEDTWSIQLRDAGGGLYSFWKQDLSDVQISRKTPMPSYRNVFAAQELDDVVAYLTGLRGIQ